MQKSSIALAGGLVLATAIALAYGSHESSPHAAANAPPVQATDIPMTDPGEPELTGELPPGHPPIGDDMGEQAPNDSVHSGMAATEPDERPALTWKAPSSWTLVPSPNGMRLATYKLPHTGADKAETELVVTRAGGDVESNVKRWIGQFDPSSYTLKETHKTVRGIKVTLTQIDGKYKGMDGTSQARDGWSMLAAIVETTGQFYFFKMLGPSSSVHAAAKPFDEMIASVSPNAL
jgi:hypothetical protein